MSGITQNHLSPSSPVRKGTLSLVIPVFNEAETIPYLLAQLAKLRQEFSAHSLSVSQEWILVNDGSRDSTLEILKREMQNYPELKVISFSRNFGQQMAVLAGLEFASGDFVAVLDADLQDPPAHLGPMLALMLNEKADVVLGRRKARTGESAFKVLTAKIFYALMDRFTKGRIPPGVGDFRLMRAPVVEAILACSENARFNRGLFAWVGFKQVFYEFDRPPRETGQSSYLPTRMLHLAWTAFVGHTEAIIRLPWLLGLVTSGLTFFAAAVFGVHSLPAIFLYALTACVLFLSVAVLGEYLLQVHWESKRRPNFIVSFLAGFKRIASNQDGKILVRSKGIGAGRMQSGGLLLNCALDSEKSVTSFEKNEAA